MKRLNLFGFSLLMGILLFAASSPASAEDEIRFGIIGPMRFSYGQEQWNGAQMAADEINEAGGIKVGNKKMKITVIKADSNEFFSIAAAASAMEQLILRDKCNFVLGGLTSEATLAMQDVAMDHKTIFFSAGPAHPQLCDRVAENYARYKYYFRGTPFNSNYLQKNILNQLRSISVAMKKQLNIESFKIAILAEKALWVDPIVKEFETTLPKMGMEVVGTWRPQPTAKDLMAELKAIEATNCHIIMAVINGPAGVTLGRQYGELKIPAVIMGIISQASTLKYYEATQKMADYVVTLGTYTPELEINELTQPFIKEYMKRYNEVPQYTANTHQIIKYAIKQAIEDVGSLDPEKLIPYLESGITKIPAGVAASARDELGRPTHDLVWGPNYTVGIGEQWQEGKLVAIWPHFKWMSPYWEFSVEPPDKPNEMTYKGLYPFKIAPWVLQAYGKK
ncbi:MAG: ABC transporter substrate-binding protein [Desulfobacteraceae bacterium]|nr:ABC transporter substrate-binding protein [Desulfobacteraceae bacterium]